MTTTTERPHAGPPQERSRVTAVLATLPDDVDGVLACLERLQENLEAEHGPRDGVACFNRLYLRITRDVRAQLGDDQASDFLGRLAVEFARRYLQALRAEAAGGVPPRCWTVLIGRRSRRRTDPVEHAVVGINAHVNFDLAPAVVRTCTVLGRGAPGPAERADYRALHDVVAHHTSLLVEHGETPGAATAEQLAAAVAGCSAVLAREAVWRQALQLWDQRSRPTEYEREIDALDRRTALIGRGLLTPGALT